MRQQGVVVSPLNGILLQHRLTSNSSTNIFASFFSKYYTIYCVNGKVVQSDLALGTESVHLGDVFAFALLKIVIY